MKDALKRKGRGHGAREESGGRERGQKCMKRIRGGGGGDSLLLDLKGMTVAVEFARSQYTNKNSERESA